ncbi:MAG: GTP-binding protein [Promethearchaeota archaeon]
MSKSSDLQILLDNFIREVPDLLSALVVDFNGFIVVKSSLKTFDEELIGGITSLLDQTLNKIKRFTQSELGSGSFDIDQFRLFYIQLGKNPGALLVLIGDPYSHLDDYIPYAHIVADRISLCLNKFDISCELPSINKEANLILKSRSRNLIIIGSESVGKTALVRRLCNDTFIHDYHPTIGISLIEKSFETKIGSKFSINIFDLSSLRSFGKIRRYFFNYSDVIIIMFDYSREESLHEVEDWISEVNQFVDNKEVSFLIVGNKIDLVPNRYEIKNIAEKIALNNNCQFFESSMRTKQGLNELIEYLINYLFLDYDDKVIATPITVDFIQKLTEDEKIVFICNIDVETVDKSNIPNVLEKNVIKNIARYKEISLAILLNKIAPLEKALNRKIDKTTVLNITEKYIQKGQIKKQILKFDKDIEQFEKSNITQQEDI